MKKQCVSAKCVVILRRIFSQFLNRRLAVFFVCVCFVCFVFFKGEENKNESFLIMTHNCNC